MGKREGSMGMKGGVHGHERGGIRPKRPQPPLTPRPPLLSPLHPRAGAGAGSFLSLSLCALCVRLTPPGFQHSHGCLWAAGPVHAGLAPLPPDAVPRPQPPT